MNSNRRLFIYLPIAFALVLIAGIFLGTKLYKVAILNNSSFLRFSGGNTNVLNDVINYVSQDYVDSVGKQKLQESAIKGLLESLDPHSMFIPASEFKEANDPLMGNFDGIGVQFRIERDTVAVINTVTGGPSEKVGILAGDRIVKVDEKPFTGKKITNEIVMKALKGQRGTIVNVSVFRRGQRKPIGFKIVRNVIPTYSIDISYPVNTTTGYIKLSKFSATTADELSQSLTELSNKGIHKLILDLRGNSGGYLQAAIAVADQFLKDKKLIVYTEGHNRPRNYAYATSEGQWENNALVVLIDEGSASAAEIVAGALQDNDRCMVVGRRSFGKGLVQEQLNLRDGSAIRLTIARYYTPTGRCIQKPYNNGTEDYYGEYYHRFTDGELESSDSIKFADSLKFKTPGGKTVYGGGGIMPDVFIPIEKDLKLKYYNEAVNKGTLYQFAFDYTDTNRKSLKRFGSFEAFDRNFKVDQFLFDAFVAYAAKNEVKGDHDLIAAARPHLESLLKAYIARNIYDEKGFYPIYLRSDKAFIAAVNILQKGK
ncbi:MAG TPA: S41 family peptidase [Bacteroidales bacterium]